MKLDVTGILVLVLVLFALLLMKSREGVDETLTGPTGPATQPVGVAKASDMYASAPKAPVFGPEFVGYGTPSRDGTGGDGDGTKTRTYPELLGGKAPAGPTGPQSSVVLPPLSSLGLDGDARFLPYSRTPGDMDRIPDPYRVSQSWLPSRYSYSKTEPAPFLTDFSAFLK